MNAVFAVQNGDEIIALYSTEEKAVSFANANGAENFSIFTMEVE